MTASKKTAYKPANVHFPDPRQIDTVKQAASILGVSFSEFMRETALEKSAKIIAADAKKRGECPACGRAHRRAKRHEPVRVAA